MCRHALILSAFISLFPIAVNAAPDDDDILLLFIPILGNSGNNAGLTGLLNDTGITFGGDYLGVYPGSNNPTCTSNITSPQDCHHGRDATHNDDTDGHAGFSFTKLDADGNKLSVSATEWSCVLDNVTGLIWEVKTNDNGWHDKDTVFRWGGYSALSAGFGTYYNDWD